MHRLSTAEELQAFVNGHAAVLVYFSSPGCGVCAALKPRVLEMVAEEFPELAVAEVDCESSTEAAAQSGIFAVPTVVVWFDGRETVRKSRAFSVGELRTEMERPYALLFEA